MGKDKLLLFTADFAVNSAFILRMLLSDNAISTLLGNS